MAVFYLGVVFGSGRKGRREFGACRIDPLSKGSPGNNVIPRVPETKSRTLGVWTDT